MEGVVVDRNSDGKITDADKYYYKAPAAPVTMGFASRFEYRNWDLGFALRASLGNYVYNDAFASVANMSNSELFSKSKYLVNRPTDVLADNWQTTETKSIQTDYWVRNASILKRWIISPLVTVSLTFSSRILGMESLVAFMVQ